MSHGNQKGFTIIEVVLFLALSALFISIAFMGLRGRTAAVQFTDSMRSLHSYLISEQNKVLNGVNSSAQAPSTCAAGTDTGKSNNCILVGRVVSFGQTPTDLSAVEISVLYGDKPSQQDLSSKSDLELLEESSPKPDLSQDKYGISWGSEFQLVESVNIGDTGNYDRIGWLRSPGSTRLIPIVFEESVADLDGDYYKPSSLFSKLGDQVNARLCFKGAEGQLASIRFGDGNGNSSVDLIFDDKDCSP